MACDGDARTSVGGVVVGEMMRLVAWCVHGCFGCRCAAARTHAGGAFGSACRTHLSGGDRQGGGPCFRDIEQNGDNQGAIHVDPGSYADAMFAKKWI